MTLSGMRAPLGMRAAAMVLVAVAVLACVPTFARAAMPSMPGRDCAGPGCEQIACARPDPLAAPPKQSAEPLALAVTPDVQASPPQDHTMAVSSPLASVGWPPVRPLAPRSPPVA
jgi:hypothetical protein